MDARIKELLTRLSFFAQDGMTDKPIVEIAKLADALLMEVARQSARPKPANQQLQDVAQRLRNAGATLPAPPVAGTIESAMNHALCIALAVVEDAIAAEAAQPVGQQAGKFFAYDDETGFDLFDTAEEAKKAAQESIDEYRHAAGEGWPEEVENVCWGVVLGTTSQVELPDDYDGSNGAADYTRPVDYVLTECQQPAIAKPVAVDTNSYAFHAARGVMGTENSLQDDILRRAIEAYLLHAASAQPVSVPEIDESSD